VHCPVEIVDVEEMVLLALGQQDVLLHVTKDSVQRVLRNRGQEIERSRRASDVGSLSDVSVGPRTWRRGRAIYRVVDDATR